MSTDIVARTTAADLAEMSPTLQGLAEWAQQLDAAMRIAKALCNTSFVPKHFQGKPEETAAAILTGSELGLGPMAALRVFYVINGRPEMYADAKVAILTAHGHRVWTDERTDESVTVSGRRKGEDRVVTIEMTIEEAKRAGWTTNATYAKTPKDMLWARAAGRVCKLVAPELLHGIATVGEPDEPPIQATATVGTPLTAAEILAPKAPAAAPLTSPSGGPRPDARTGNAAADSNVAAPPPAEVKTPMMTPAQNRMMFALLAKKGYTEKDAAMVLIATAIGREVTSRGELDRAEAGRVIDHLETLADVDADTPGGEA